MKDQFSGGKIVVENALAFWVSRVYQAARGEMYRAFRAHDVELTPEQWAVLVRLFEQDGRTQGEISESTFRDPPTISRILDGMEARGLVERRPHPEDGRARAVHLTRRGRALEKKLVPVVEELVARMVRDVDEQDLVTTRATLKRIFANLSG
jgi:DNA-binding MarR family transcriptional regulator